MKPLFAYLLALAATVALCIPLYRMADSQERQAGAINTLVDVQREVLRVSYKRLPEIKQDAAQAWQMVEFWKTKCDQDKKEMENYMASKGVLRGWRQLGGQ